MIVRAVESVTLAFAAMTAAIFNNLAIAVTPLSPAIYTAVVIHEMLVPSMGWAMAGVVGFTFALGLESAGFKSFHIALTEKGWQSKLYPVAYVVLGVVIVVMLKPSAWFLGVGMFLLVALVYSAEAKRRARLERKAELSEQKALEEAEKLAKLEAKREALRLEAQAKRDYELARLAAQRDVKLAQVQAQLSAPSREGLPKLSETFPTDSRRFTDENWAQLRQMLATMSKADVAKQVGVSERTITNWSAKL